MSAPIETLRAALRRRGSTERVSGRGVDFTCPAHRDTNPSLSTWADERGDAALHCHAGCSRAAVLTALGLTPDDLRTAPAASREPDAVYEYQRADGSVAYRVLRFPGHRFFQQAPDGTWSVSGIPKLIYRLLAVLAAAAAGKRIFAVEGEKDVHAVEAEGEVGTCNSGGAGKWKPEFAEHLRGASEVVIVADIDADGTGYRHARDVRNSLVGIVPSIKVVRAATGKDTSDHLAAGHSLDELEPFDLDAALPAHPVASVSPVNAAADTWPAPLDDAAHHGLLGEIVRALEPHTEADPAGLLVTLLAVVGSIIGDGPHWRVDSSRHALRIFPVLVGATSKGRKGTALSAVRTIVSAAFPTWTPMRGLSSGEGLISAVRDATVETKLVKQAGMLVPQQVETDPGVLDKRLFVIEEELASMLKVMGREGNTLSAVIRQAWDGGDLATMTKHHSQKATGAHITILAHVTRDELLRLLTSTEAANGFANRFLWTAVRRARTLPRGGHLDDHAVTHLAARLNAAVTAASHVNRITLDARAARIWEHIYPDLSDGVDGMLGAVTSRAEAYVLRIAAIYAAIDAAALINREHLRAALAVWDRSEASAKWIFGAASGDQIADELMQLMRANGELTATALSTHLSNHSKRVRHAKVVLARLVQQGLCRRAVRATSGRSTEAWIPAPLSIPSLHSPSHLARADQFEATQTNAPTTPPPAGTPTTPAAPGEGERSETTTTIHDAAGTEEIW